MRKKEVDSEKLYTFSNGELNNKLKTNFREKMRSQEKEAIENQLESLGVHKIDPDNPDDIKLLEETMYPIDSHKLMLKTTQPAPDLKLLADFYSIYIYDGTRSHNGAKYEYRYIKVVDNKGYNLLTETAEINAVKKGKGTVASEIINFNMQYLFSSLLSSNPAGAIADWSMQNIFTFLSANSNVTYKSNENLYKITHAFVTSMTYYYVNNKGWKYVGAGAICSVARGDTFAGNVNGKAKVITESKEFTLKTPKSSYAIINDYLKNMSHDVYYCCIDELGDIDVIGYNLRETLSPVFVSLPAQLLMY